ncbi:MAG: NADH/ubiquinone/plastoquinone (complex I) [Salinarimonadaceae bacterium]|nr:MAG: NADH/ubiquinone/plastoquinone (complex I) [Salinarimonadaceae bacterium]
MTFPLGPLLPLIALIAPLAIGLLAAIPATRARSLALLPLAPLPALALAFFGTQDETTLAPDLLLGVTLTLDGNARYFLGFVALLWMGAGLYATAYMRDKPKIAPFVGFWCMTLCGNLGVFLAADIITFYVSFAVVSLCAYLLVVHDGTQRALHAGIVYIVLAVLGETCLLLGFLIGAAAADSLLIVDVRIALTDAPGGEAAIALLIVGFGLKAGMFPFHVWLPLAHPAAPVPASAVLSGAIVKAGIFGLMQFLPMESGLSLWGALLVITGLVSAYYGVAVGLTQRNPKSVLAYSTISQMGLVLALIGAAAGATPADNLAAATLLSLHHGFAKGALFLSVGIVAASGRRAAVPALAAAALLALSVAGFPGTGGALAKAAMKAHIADPIVYWLVTLSAIGTTLLLARFVMTLAAQVSAQERARPSPIMTASFVALAVAALVSPWFFFTDLAGLPLAYSLSASSILNGLWPVLVGGAIAAAFLRISPSVPSIPEGDLVTPVTKWLRRLDGAARRGRSRLEDLPRPDPGVLAAPLWRAASVAERAFARWSFAGLLMAAGALGVLIALSLQ